MTHFAKISYFALFHVSAEAQGHVNLSVEVDPIDVYLKCAAVLASSLRRSGSTLTILTNVSEQLARRASVLGLSELLHFEALQFTRAVPKNIQFYSAHFKLDVFRYFSESVHDLVCLVDLDAVALRPLNLVVDNPTSIFAYDITDQHGAGYSHQTLRDDIQLLSGRSREEVKWYGGEFILATPAGYRLLAETVDEVWPQYCRVLDRIHHIGDEMVVSAAISMLTSEGVEISDAGERDLVNRWWSARTECLQQPFSAAAKSAILHLPSDKFFLASQAQTPFEPTKFVERYREYVRAKLWARRLANPILNIATGKRKHVGRL